MKYVLNSSVGFKWVMPEINSDKALRLRDDFRNSVHELLAPDVFPIELGHARANHGVFLLDACCRRGLQPIVCR